MENISDFKPDVLVIGSGMGALSAASLLASDGLKVCVLEQNYLAGGCTSSYWRKGFVFETGATTVVGLDEGMPLHFLLEKTKIQIPELVPLDLPMQVHLPNGLTINKFQNLEQWIAEAEKIFPNTPQREFWTFCHRISEFVWQTSVQQTHFPPSNLSDCWQMLKNVSLKQFQFSPYIFRSTAWLLQKFGLHTNENFVRYVNEQLLITAQNHASEVNVLFGATALCYTHYGNYYINGGLINLVNPFTKYIELHNGNILLRHKVQQIRQTPQGYEVQTNKGKFTAQFVVAGLPINNLLELYPDNPRAQSIQKKLYPSEKLNSAFQMGIAFKNDNQQLINCLHHQIHLAEPLPIIGSRSIFLSLSHPKDSSRSDTAGITVASVSTHVPNPAQNFMFDKKEIENIIVETLEKHGFLRKQDIVYQHSSAPSAWEQWTQRQHGFVGGYPQYMQTKPWQMLDARLDHHKAYLCGDTAYPGQGIAGATLSGIIAYNKLKSDWL